LNFKTICILFLCIGCGVKAPPQSDSVNDVPSIVDMYKKSMISDISDESAIDSENINKKKKDTENK